MKTSVTKSFKCCWWILTVWLCAVPILLQCLIVYDTEDLKPKKIPKKKETNVTMWFNKNQNTDFWGFRVFYFALYLKLKLGNLGKCFLLKFLVVYKTQNRKNNKKEENFNFPMCLEKEKYTFPRFPSFRFYSLLEIENLETLESFRLLQIFIDSVALTWERIKPFIKFQISRLHALMFHVK